MRIVFNSVETDVKNNRWEIRYDEIHDEDPENIRVQPITVAMPMDSLEWRAAEYNIDPSDINTLVDIVICERFVTMDFYKGPDSLINAPDIETARKAYLTEIARIKLLYRISTRSKDHVLQQVKNESVHDPLNMAIKATSVMLHRHHTGVQELQPEVVTVLARYKEAIESVNGGK